MLLNALKESPLIAKLIARAENYYLGLAAREQLAVRLLIIFLAVIIIVFGMLIPAGNFQHRAEQQYLNSMENLEWMQQHKTLVASSTEQRAARDPGQSLLGIANSSSKGFQISFKRYEPVGDNGLSLWMENIAFNNMIRWLERLDKRHGISVQEISVERQQNKGLVNVRLVLQG